MLDYKLIGKRIKAAREDEKLSQEDLAALVGVSITHISLIENAKKKVSLELISRIANVLDVTVDNLIGGDNRTTDAKYLSQLGMQLDGCNGYEKQVICELACAIRKTLKQNRGLI